MRRTFLDLRLLAFRLAIVLGSLVLLGQTWNLQVAQGQFFQERADRNRFRLLSLPAPRGVVYDRNNQLFVRNVPSFTLSMIPADLPPEQEERVISRLIELLGDNITLTPSSIQEMVAAGRETAPFTPIQIADDLPRNLALGLEEERLYLPGVVINVDSKREYLTGSLTSLLLGYVGPVPQEQLEEYLGKGDYSPNDLVGLTGLELTFEDVLRGENGQKHIEVDALGRELRTLGSILDPQPGKNLILTLDLQLQERTTEILQQGMERVGAASGVAIVMDPRTGEILAMVSLPNYDNNLFIGGISEEDLQTLIQDPRHPLVNHAVSGQYPPGSTFKLVVASAGLEERVVSPSSQLFCAGSIAVPNRYAPEDPSLDQIFRDWLPSGHGLQNITQAIANSCDIYFYLLAGGYQGRNPTQDFEGLGLEKFADYARLFGFGEGSGIELSGEASGLVPDANWKRETYGEPWTTGDTYNMAIGQGFVLATPLQVLNAAATVANGGTLLQPQIVREVRDSAGNIIRPFQVKVIRQVPVSPENLEVVRRGMRAAATWGTAVRAALPGVAVAGKTGTAEHPGPRDAEGHLPTHAWFVGFAPADEPEVAVVVFLEKGNGAQNAAPLAAQILAAYFNPPQITLAHPGNTAL
ncbi:MAG: penicillin-binding protein 2 [Chloroflexi bacterium]|nr:penicillin-binding protein 2 [Chloroflexota bacterium]